MFIWVGILLLSLAWVYLVPVYTGPGSEGLLLFILGTISIVYGCFCTGKKSGGLQTAVPASNINNGEVTWGHLWLLILPVAAIIFMPFQWKLPAVLLAASLVSMHFLRRNNFIGLGLMAAALITTFQGMVIQLFWKLLPRMQEEYLFGRIAAWIGNLFGLDAVYHNSTLFLNHTTGTIAYGSTWDKFGIVQVLLVLTGSFTLMLFFRIDTKWACAKTFAAVLTYSVLRYTFLISMMTDDGSNEIFWSLPVQIATLCLLPFLLNKVTCFKSIKPWVLQGELLRVLTSKKAQTAILVSSLSFASLFTSFIYNDPGMKKAGRVLMDERHCDWEWTDKVYDTEWYGEKSGYNYYCLYDYLSHYYNISRNYKTITKELLSEFDTLILKTPTKPFDKDEIHCIEEFVKNGGSVALIGDHTNVFGISTNFNPLATKFGLKFRYDSTYNLASGSLTEYDRPGLLPHPVVQRMPHFLFATSCTIEAGLSAEDIMTGYSIRAVDADYSQDNFFPENGASPQMRIGLFSQAVGVRYGSGRVFAIADSTPFSNFWMFMEGKPELILGMMGWLNRYNTYPVLKTTAFISGILLLAVTVWLLRKRHAAENVIVLVISALLAGITAALVCTYANSVNYKQQATISPYTTVAYERQYSDYTLPVSWKEFMAPAHKGLDTFYVWNQRLGLVPHISHTLKKSIDEGNIIAVVNPKNIISERDSKALKAAVAGGKNLLLLGNKRENVQAFGSFTRLFAIDIIDSPNEGKSAYYDNNKEVQLSGEALTLSGGKPLVKIADGRAAGCEVEYGKGKVIAFADSNLFFNTYMGTVSTVPNEHQKSIYELEFWLLKLLK